VKRVADILGVARSNLMMQAVCEPSRQRRGRRPQPETELVAEIQALIAGQRTYGYRRIHALLRRQRREGGAAPVNVKRVYRVMKAHGLMLERPDPQELRAKHIGHVLVDSAVDRPWSEYFCCMLAGQSALPECSWTTSLRRLTTRMLLKPFENYPTENGVSTIPKTRCGSMRCGSAKSA